MYYKNESFMWRGTCAAPLFLFCGIIQEAEMSFEEYLKIVLEEDEKLKKEYDSLDGEYDKIRIEVISKANNEDNILSLS